MTNFLKLRKQSKNVLPEFVMYYMKSNRDEMSRVGIYLNNMNHSNNSKDHYTIWYLNLYDRSIISSATFLKQILRALIVPTLPSKDGTSVYRGPRSRSSKIDFIINLFQMLYLIL